MARLNLLWAIVAVALIAPRPIEALLKMVHVVWRHGDRSPADPTFPTDVENQVWTWPQGWGELSQIGMKQHFELGKFLRKRYVDSGFLMANYNASHIYVRSSDYNRTIMSALSNLAGMYPPTEDGFLPELQWRPIPVHVVPKDNDPMIWMDRSCPKSQSIFFDEILESPSVQKVTRENAHLLDELRRFTGHPIADLNEIRFIYDPLNCEHDTTMIALLENLGAYDGFIPPYATALMFELHQENDRYYVQVWYRNETGGKMVHQLKIRECSSLDCPLDELVAIARRRTPVDWMVACGYPALVEKPRYTRAAVAATVLGVITAILLILLMITLAVLVRQKGHFT